MEQWTVHFFRRSILSNIFKPLNHTFSDSIDRQIAQSVNALTVCRCTYCPSMIIVVLYLDFLQHQVLGKSLITSMTWQHGTSIDRQSFCSPVIGQNSPSCFSILEPSINGDHLRYIDEAMGRRLLRRSLLHKFLHNPLHFHFGQLSCKRQIKTH